MKIKIRCGNFSEFDAALGRYVECGQTLLVSSDQVGESVQCSKCDQPVEVPYHVAAKGGQAATTKAKPNQVRPRKPTGASGTRDRRPASTDGPKATAETSNSNRPKRSSKSRRDNSELPTSDVMAMDFAGSSSQQLQEDRKPRCRKCGHLVQQGRCTACRYVEPSFEKVYQQLDDIEIVLVGAQRWVTQTISEGISIRAFEYGLHILLAILGSLLAVLAILGLTGVGIGPLFGALLLLLVICSGSLYVGLIYKGHQFLRSPKARLAWFQKPFWNLLLSLARRMKWQGYDSQLKGRKIITVNEPGFSDHNVDELEGLKACEVLDLEGTNVSDATLYKLYQLKNLKVVVLKRTNVSHDGVFRLQQSVPRLWVWY